MLIRYIKHFLIKALDLINIISNKSLLSLIVSSFRLFRLEYKKFISINEYIKKESSKVEFLYDNVISLHYSPPVFNSPIKKNEELFEVKAIHDYIAIISGGRIVGGSNVVILNNTQALYELFNYNTEQRYKYTDGAIVSYNYESCFILAKDSKIILEEAIVLSGNFSFNYYHFIFEILSKIEKVEQLNLNTNIPFVIDKVCFETPQFSELLKVFNKKNRSIISINKREIISINKLYFISGSNILPSEFINDNSIKPSDILFNLTTLSSIRFKLLALSSEKEFPKRIYISRANASKRRSFNENDVFTVLKNYNFELISPEQYSIADQISMFNKAEYIVGGSGAAFTNLLFCNEKCKVVIFIKDIFPLSIFSTIASHIGADLIYYTENKSAIKYNNIHESFNIDIENLNNFVYEWVSS